VTRFFRDPGAYEALAKTVVPELVRQHASDQPIRIWVAGCSTGEEAYSLAMLFVEELAAAKLSTRLQLFASDVSLSRDLRAQWCLSRVDRSRRIGGAARALLHAREQELPSAP